MPRRFLSSFALAALGLSLLLGSSEAWAGAYDLRLSNLGTMNGGVVTGNDGDFRSLASELGVLMAPKPVDPADSLGLSGFAVSADISLNTISNTQPFWTQSTRGDPSKMAPTLQIMGRKGLWPGIEVGAGATKLFDSRMWTIAGYGKLALHEGFHHMPIPSIALRGMFSRLLGAKDLDITTVSVDASLSHVFGVGRTFSITPYAGYQALFVFSRTGIIDSTPDNDEYTGGPVPCTNGDPTCFVQGEFVFNRQDVILRHRPFIGARFIFSVLRVGIEAMIVPGGKSKADIDTGGMTQTITDGSGLQQQYTISFGLDF
jgi:hypothetical protein